MELMIIGKLALLIIKIFIVNIINHILNIMKSVKRPIITMEFENKKKFEKYLKKIIFI